MIAARIDKGLNQAELARKINVDRSTLCRLENGRYTGSVEVWDKLERVLGVPQQKLREARNDGD